MEEIVVVCVVVFLIYVICRSAKGLRSHAYLQKTTLPGNRCASIPLYYSTVKSIYRQSAPTRPPLCLILQMLSGICLGYSKEKIFQFYLCFKPVVLLFKAETVEKVLSSTKHIEKSREYHFIRPWLGTGLLTSGGQKWHSRRKLMSPSFHFKILEEFLPVFHEQSILLADKLEGTSGTPWVDIVPFITSCTLDVICQTAMGVRIDAQGGGYKDYAQAIHELGEILYYRIIRPWLYVDWIFALSPSGRRFRSNLQMVHNFTKKVIREKKAEMTASPTAEATDSPSHGKRYRPLLQMLLEYHLKDPSFSEEDIREEVDTIMFEGHDTTAMALSWCLYMIGLHEQVQRLIHEELDDIFEDDVTREISRQDLAQMKYLECVIKETLRLYPSVPFFSREVEEEFQILDHKVRSGTILLFLPHMLHKDPEHFPDPEKFIPERFSPENCIGRHPFAYVPFSAGPRNCIGQKFAFMEMKAVLANVLRRLQVTSLDSRDKVNVTPNLVLRNVQPLRLKFTRRRIK